MKSSVSTRQLLESVRFRQNTEYDFKVQLSERQIGGGGDHAEMNVHTQNFDLICVGLWILAKKKQKQNYTRPL